MSEKNDEQDLPSLENLAQPIKPDLKIHVPKKAYLVQVKGREVEVAYRTLKKKPRKGVR